ncbi:uncharacterized protein [Vicugna pacos]|uniref:Uncharacterized protein n=1 Tax=Vicugna pacos TaxID=30538 RepID=A0ABM5CNX6_VICPA
MKELCERRMRILLQGSAWMLTWDQIKTSLSQWVPTMLVKMKAASSRFLLRLESRRCQWNRHMLAREGVTYSQSWGSKASLGFSLDAAASTQRILEATPADPGAGQHLGISLKGHFRVKVILKIQLQILWFTYCKDRFGDGIDYTYCDYAVLTDDWDDFAFSIWKIVTLSQDVLALKSVKKCNQMCFLYILVLTNSPVRNVTKYGNLGPRQLETWQTFSKDQEGMNCGLVS